MSNLREEIAKLLAGYAWKWVEKNEEEYLKKADLILSLIDQHFDELTWERGYMKLDENVSTAKITLKDGRIFVWSK